jgi:hypothetical protein
VIGSFSYQYAAKISSSIALNDIVPAANSRAKTNNAFFFKKVFMTLKIKIENLFSPLGRPALSEAASHVHASLFDIPPDTYQKKKHIEEEMLVPGQPGDHRATGARQFTPGA